MSKFNEYAKRLDGMAKEAFAAYKDAEAAYNIAKEKAAKYPEKRGGQITDKEYEAAAARAKLSLISAEETYTKMRAELEKKTEDMKKIRTELEAAVNENYAASPEDIKQDTLELLKSGILKPAEYEKLFNAACNDNNYTMARIIGKYADTAANNGNLSPTEQQTLRIIAHAGTSETGEQYIAAYDYLADVFNRCAHNPTMINRWEELTSSTINNF